MVPKADHPTLPLTRTLTRRLWGDQCLGDVDCEGSIKVDSAGYDAVLGRTLGLFDRQRDGVAWTYSIKRMIAPLIKYPLANQSS